MKKEDAIAKDINIIASRMKSSGAAYIAEQELAKKYTNEELHEMTLTVLTMLMADYFSLLTKVSGPREAKRVFGGVEELIFNICEAENEPEKQ